MIALNSAKDLTKGLYYRALPYFASPEDKDIEIIVTSPGGAGTSMLLKFIGDYRKTNHPHNGDKLKHMSRPLARKFHSVKVIYIIGNPIEVSLSLLRRDFFRIHCSIHGSLILPAKKDFNAEKVIESGVDYLNLNNLYANWTNKKYHQNECLVIDFDHIWQRLDVLLEFSGLTEEIDAFPKKKVRNSILEDMPAEVLKKFSRTYEEAISIRTEIVRQGGYLLLP